MGIRGNHPSWESLNRVVPPGPLTIIKRYAMACDFEVALNDATAEVDAQFALDALDEIDRLESRLSIFRSDSTISRVNLLASELDVPVEEDVWEILCMALDYAEQTHGAFDPTASPLWRVWGFAKRDGEFPSAEAIAQAREKTGIAHVRLNPERRAVAFDQSGVELNFGAIGKGYALDRAAQILLEGGVNDFLIQGGKSSALAHGGRVNDYRYDAELESSADAPVAPTEELDEESGLPKRCGKRARTAEEDAAAALEAWLPSDLTSIDPSVRYANQRTGWTVGLSHPLAPDKRLGELWLQDTALGSSGSTYQFFRSGGKRYSHIIDPRSGYPAQGVLATTVLTPSAAVADALATAFFVLGPEQTQAYCDAHPEVGAIVILESERHCSGLEIEVFNLSYQTLRLY